MPYSKLKDFIKAIRSCKTAADERATISKESAAIRTSFKEDHSDTRYNNVAKLLYIHLLGYPSHYGQIEALKLVASPKFADKRLGYLAIMLLLDESQETLTLVTNCLKNDFNHPNNYIVGMALCTLGNITSEEISRDLCSEVERLLSSSNAYIRKKAILCAVKIVRKVPSLHENFLEKSLVLLSDRNNSILLTGVSLIIELCQLSNEYLEIYQKMVPTYIKLLRSIIAGSNNGTTSVTDHEVSGVNDPFLQVKLLKFFRILGKNSATASEVMHDVLAQIATNTDSSKNVGSSILYEVVLTIMEIQSDASLRVMAINILGKFLMNRDNNIRYVALNTLNRTIEIDFQAVQRHRATILECLQDPDISIKRRALDLTFALVNNSNVENLAAELLNFLESADASLKSSTAKRLCSIANKFSPNKKWYIDTVLNVFRIAGNLVDEETVGEFVKIVALSDDDLHMYSCNRLYEELSKNCYQNALVKAGVWCIGEFGHLIMKSAEHEINICKMFISFLACSSITAEAKYFVMTALLKLSSKVSSEEEKIKIKRAISKYESSIDFELQQRSFEFTHILNEKALAQNLSNSLLAPIPQPTSFEIEFEKKKNLKNSYDKKDSKRPINDLDLLGGLDLLSISSNKSPQLSASPLSSNNANLIDELFGNAPQMQQPQKQQGNTAVSPQYEAFQNDHLKLVLSPIKPLSSYDLSTFSIVATILNESSDVLTEVLLQVAVPKSIKLVMLPPNATSCGHDEEILQELKVSNPTNAQVKLRIKLGYFLKGNQYNELIEFSGFPNPIFG